MDPKAFHTLSYGVYVVSSWDNGRPTGCTANCAAQITSSPATVMVSINKDNYTNKCIADCGHFSLSVLSENSDPSIIGTFGFRSGRDTDKFENVAWQVRDALPVLSDSCAVWAGARAIFATHGHRWNLQSPPPLAAGDILLHGHTHVPAWQPFGRDNWYLNPGSVSIPKENSPRGYMLWQDGVFCWKTLAGETYHTLPL